MINAIPTKITRFRTFGWVQDPSNFRSLCDVVAVFDKDSSVHNNLLERIIPKLVEERDGRSRLLKTLNEEPLNISYSELVGTAFYPRSAARCNGIIQATVRGQVREFVSD